MNKYNLVPEGCVAHKCEKEGYDVVMTRGEFDGVEIVASIDMQRALEVDGPAELDNKDIQSVLPRQLFFDINNGERPKTTVDLASGQTATIDYLENGEDRWGDARYNSILVRNSNDEVIADFDPDTAERFTADPVDPLQAMIQSLMGGLNFDDAEAYDAE